MNDREEWANPIIIVGPGRSGTTLLSQMLNAHPDIVSVGEVNFFMQKVESAIAALGASPEIRRKVKNARADWAAMPEEAFRRDVLEFKSVKHAPATREVYAAIIQEEQVRRAPLAGRFFWEIVCPPDKTGRRWCFKEIWAGSDSFLYSWDFYNAAFPSAQFVQCVRHPFEYAKSYFGREDPAADSEAKTLFVLSQWVQMMRHNMALANTGRYYKFRLEDLVGAPEQTFQQICGFLHLPSHPHCLEAMKKKYGGAGAARDIEMPPRLLDEVEGLRALMEELGY